MGGGWHFRFIGLPVWVVVPAAIFAVWALLRLGRHDLAGLAPRTRMLLKLLRACAAVAVIAFLLEPTCSRETSELELPTVAVLIDRSGSMSVKDATASPYVRLNEAVALGLVRSELRDTSAAGAERILANLLERMPNIHSGEYASSLRAAAQKLAGFPTVHSGLKELAEALERARPEGFEELRRRCEHLMRACRQAQLAADAALVAAAGRSSDIAKGLEELAKMTRLQRALRFAERNVMPRLAGKADVRFFALEKGLAPLEPTPEGNLPETPTGGPTDFEGALAELASSTGDRQLGGILIISDGRITAGAPPLSAARALAARGTVLSAIMVGDPDQPRDAVVAGILGNTEVFLGETVRLDVRFKIAGFPGQNWELVLTKEGKELARRTVQGTGDWQLERFEFPAESPGRMHVQARLQRPSRDRPVQQGPGPVDFGELDSPELTAALSAPRRVRAVARPAAESGILREYWLGIGGHEVADLTRDPRFPNKPDGSEVLDSFEGPTDWADSYGSRLRGYLVPPLSGSYVFWLSSDDNAELWLSTDDSPANKTLIAKVPEWTAPRQWDKFPSQRSAYVELRAGMRYYVEVLHKEGYGGDNVAVGWQMPDSTVERPIPSTRLLPYREGEPAGPISGPAEEASLDNNQADIVVTVNQDPLQVLVVDASPRWDSRYLVSLLERDRRTRVVRRYRSIRLPRGETELLPKTQEELDAYDCIAIGDLQPDELGPNDQQHIANFVARRGGFLILMAGPRGMPSGYSLGGLADVMPVRNISGQAPAGASVRLGEAGAENPIAAVLDDATLNEKLWPLLPSLQWVARGVSPKPAAQVLLQTEDAERTPLAVAMRFGAGRVFYIGTDQTWRWRDRLGDRIHATFWMQVLRWGLGDRLRGKDPRLTVSLDRAIMAPDERAELKARVHLADGSPVPSPPKARLLHLPDEKVVRVLEMTRLADSADIWRAPLETLEEGDWAVEVESDHPELNGLKERRELIVRKRTGSEWLDLSADPASLAQLVGAAGTGRWGTFAEGEEVLGEFASKLEGRKIRRLETWTLWSGYWALLVVLALLSAEWILRKRLGLP